MLNISTKTINPTASYRVTMTDPDFGSTEVKTMTGADLKELAFAVGHLYDMTADIIETTETAEQTAETTETAETTGRADRIADIMAEIRNAKLRYALTAKQRVTAKCIREAKNAGAPTVCVGYCEAQHLLSGIEPDYYTTGIYGWNFDVYRIAGLTICTGYRGMIGAPAVDTAEYERKARIADTAEERIKLLAEWIAANLDAVQAAREGARV